MTPQFPLPKIEPGQLPPIVVECQRLRAVADWAETLLCNAKPMEHCEREEWYSMLTRWRAEKNAIAFHPPIPQENGWLPDEFPPDVNTRKSMADPLPSLVRPAPGGLTQPPQPPQP